MFTNNKLAKSVRLAIAFGAAATALPATQAIAQEGASDIEKISVTGSRIKRADLESASPVTVIDAKDIQNSGVVSIEGILQSLTSAGGAMTNPGVNNGSGGNTRINLRGLGSERTLVLVNGRRMIASGTGAASTVDLNTIPTAMIQRIEVLKDGASAVYGTDAVAGVVNVILKRDFEGFEANVQYGQSSESDARERSIDFTVGNSFDKGNVVFSLQYTNRGDASQADRPFSECPIYELSDGSDIYCGGSSYSEGGHIWGTSTHGMTKSGTDDDGNAIAVHGDEGYYGKTLTQLNTDGTPKLNDAGETSTVFVPWSDIVATGDKQTQYYDASVDASLGERKVGNISGLGDEYHDYVSSGDNNDLYNFSSTSYLSTPMERINLSTNATYELTDSVLFFTEATYTKRWSKQQMAPQPIWNSEDWVYDSSWMNSELLDGGFLQEGETFSYGRRMVETGPRKFTQNVDTIRFIVGLEGEIGDYYWDASYNKGKNDSVDTLANLHNIGSINDAVQNELFDPLSQDSWRGASIVPYVYTEQNSGGAELDIYAASISGDLFELPAGIVGFAAGFEYREESAYYTPDSLTAQGLANDPRVEPTSGSFDVTEAYAEFAVPLLEDSFLADNMELSAAVRYFDYSTFGDDITWKLGLQWNVSDMLMIRGVASTAFRAPTVDELFSGNSPSFEYINHAATQQAQAEVTVGGNDLLTPEEADIMTLGVVFEPLEGLSITADYYNIELTNAIETVDANYVANLCLSDTGVAQNNNNAICQSAAISIDGSGRIKFNNGLQNVGGNNTSGVDLNILYAFEAAGLDWKASLDTSFLNEFEQVQLDGSVIDYTGMITGNIGAYAELKSNFKLSVADDTWGASYEMRYIGEMDDVSCVADPSECYAPSVDAIVYHDVNASYDYSESVSFSGGINNLLDEEPPYYTGNQDSNTSPYTYDVLGRYFYLKTTVRF